MTKYVEAVRDCAERCYSATACADLFMALQPGVLRVRLPAMTPFEAQIIPDAESRTRFMGQPSDLVDGALKTIIIHPQRYPKGVIGSYLKETHVFYLWDDGQASPAELQHIVNGAALGTVMPVVVVSPGLLDMAEAAFGWLSAKRNPLTPPKLSEIESHVATVRAFFRALRSAQGRIG